MVTITTTFKTKQESTHRMAFMTYEQVVEMAREQIKGNAISQIVVWENEKKTVLVK